MAAATSELIVVAVRRVQAEAPALAKLKLVFGLELTAGGLTGAGHLRALPGRGPGPAGRPRASPTTPG